MGVTAMDNPRELEITDPFGRKWMAELRWLQNAITIRHSDSVDVKWELTASDGTAMEKVIALMHPDLLAVSKKTGRQLSDAWCIRLAGHHLSYIVETWEDAEKTIVTPTRDQLEALAGRVEQSFAAAR
jgi:hypothetical protein